MDQFLTYVNQYGLGIAVLLFLVYFLGKYVLGNDKKKDDRIQKLENKVETLQQEVSTLKDQQNAKALEINAKYAEMAQKMVDVIDRNTQEFTKSRDVQEKLQNYLTYFIENNKIKS